MSLSTKELDLIEFLVAQVASLSSSLAVEVEVAGEAVVTESSDLPPMACEVVSLQPIPVVLLAPSYDRGYIDHWVVPPPYGGLRASGRWRRGVLQGEAT
jgi:hypothetical protein